ncbi:MAG: glycosyltransferase family 1 protein, partial [Deltaproteobacteria bacterium]|nr:glycosyltransferase family 1 protein [Deltaproteobacteria bacterium]
RYGSDVGFVGTFEGDRAEKMLYLARHGIRVRIWGNGWDKWKGKNSNLIIEGRSVDGEDYVKTINATKINLGFLRKINRDETTSRSVEIPACGGFLLAERTERHLALFEEGKEAEFFNSSKELLEKAKRYLADEKSRKRIARAGRERCLKNGYSTREQIESMFVLIRSA